MTAWEMASSVETEETPGDLWSRIEAQLPRRESETSVEDLALIVKGLASEVRELRQTVEDLRDRGASQRVTKMKSAYESRSNRDPNSASGPNRASAVAPAEFHRTYNWSLRDGRCRRKSRS